MIRLTKKHRVTIRNICPLNPLLPILHFHGQDYVNAVAAALNAIASESERVAVATHDLRTLIRQPNDGPRFSAWASSVVGAAERLRDAERAAKRARK